MQARQVPLYLLTGFLGSGKTTLVRRILGSRGWADTAVLVNEVGEVGLDHTLMWGSGASIAVMENGCICCSVSEDLIACLEELFWKRLQRRIPDFSRVIVETTGLADPGPIVQALRAHPLVNERYRLQAVVCTVDAVRGQEQLREHPESVAQAVTADVILLTKTDLVDDAVSRRLEAALVAMNPVAPIRRLGIGATEAIDPTELFPWPGRAKTPSTADAKLGRSPKLAWTGESRRPPFGPGLLHRRIRTAVRHFDRTLRFETFETALRATLQRHAAIVLRLKGLMEFVDRDRPVVVQVVGDEVFPFEEIALPDARALRGFLVAIVDCPQEGSEATEVLDELPG